MMQTFGQEPNELPWPKFLTLPLEVRQAVFGYVVPSSMLHVLRPGCILDEIAEDKLHSVTCRHMTDVEWMATALPELHAQEYAAVNRVKFPSHLACVMSGIGGSLQAHSGWLSLLLTCRSLYLEFLPILYSRPKFSFHDWTAFSRFFSVVPSGHQAHIRALCVAWGWDRPLGSSWHHVSAPMSAEWRNIWTIIRQLPKLLHELDVYVTVPDGLDRTFYKAVPDADKESLLHEALRDIQVAPNGRFTLTEIIGYHVLTPEMQLANLSCQAPPAYTIGEPPQERLSYYSSFPFQLRWIHAWNNIPTRLEREARRCGLLDDDSRSPPWHGGFGRTLQQLSIRRHTLLECMALESLLMLKSGRCHWKPQIPLRREFIIPLRRALAERERLAVTTLKPTFTGPG